MGLSMDPARSQRPAVKRRPDSALFDSPVSPCSTTNCRTSDSDAVASPGMQLSAAP